MNDMDKTPIFALDAVTFAYPGRPTLFGNLSLALRGGEQIGLHGPNGSGKTTLLRIIMGLERPQSGRIFHQGKAVDSPAALRELRCGVGLVLQNSEDQLFSATVIEDVAFGPLNLGLTRREARDRAMETLDSMDLAKLAERETQRLSVGEKKMVSIASVLSMRPRALLLDEPTASLDADARDRILSLLRSETRARIIVSHDEDFLARSSSSFIRINGGRIETRLQASAQV